MNILLVRHGESYANANRIIDCLPPGEALTALGEVQSRNAGIDIKKMELFKSFCRCYCSPFLRTKRTCELLELRLPISEDSRLKELDYGDLNQKNTNNVNAEIKKAFNNAKRHGQITSRFGKTGENYLELLTRIYQFLLDILRNNENVVVVSHNTVIIEIYEIWRKITKSNLSGHLDIKYATPMLLCFPVKKFNLIKDEMSTLNLR